MEGGRWKMAVIPAKAGIYLESEYCLIRKEIPAFAGMTEGAVRQLADDNW